MTGRVSDTGAITARASGTLKRPLHLPATTIDTAAIAADITGQMSAPRVQLRLSDGSLVVAGMSADRIVGEAQATLGKTITGNFAMSGGTQGQPLTARGKLTGGNGVWRIANLDATLGGLRLNAPQLEFADGGVTAAFDASGSLAGYAGLDRGTLTARGTVATKGELELNVTGQLTNLREGEARFDLVTFDATASDGQARVTGKLKGRVGAALDLSFGASGSHERDGWIGAATLEGTVDQLPVKTSRPANWRFGENSWLIDAELGAFGGRFAANLSTRCGDRQGEARPDGRRCPRALAPCPHHADRGYDLRPDRLSQRPRAPRAISSSTSPMRTRWASRQTRSVSLSKAICATAA